MFEMYFVLAIVIIILSIIIYYTTIWIIRSDSKLERLFFVIYILSSLLFLIVLNSHDNPYYKAIDPFNGDCYSPFSENHFFTLITFIFLFWIFMLLVWKNGKTLPPLTLVLSYCFIIIGIIVNILITFQVSKHDTSTLHKIGNDGTLYFIFTPIIGIILAILLLIKTLNQDFEELKFKEYKNPVLNKLNNFLYKSSILPVWTFIFTFPVFIIITMILILFGQDADSMIKVFTNTTTWKFSQQIHPPILDHHGHYLCTVAAKGNPDIVKPIYIGKRRGQPIIVNRQLQIANAFEEMIQRFTPRFHRFLRKIYDNYGYNLSTKINNEKLSNLTYILMKPLEYFFIICLYLFWKHPEELISKQYKNK